MYKDQVGPVGFATNAIPYRGDMPITGNVERVLALDEITNRVSVTNGDLHECWALVRDIADSLTGALPQAKETNGNPPPMPNGRVHGLANATENTMQIVRSLRAEIERLRGL